MKQFISILLVSHFKNAYETKHMASVNLADRSPMCLFQNGFAVVRPPGHHAEESTAMSVHTAASLDPYQVFVAGHHVLNVAFFLGLSSV